MFNLPTILSFVKSILITRNRKRRLIQFYASSLILFLGGFLVLSLRHTSTSQESRPPAWRSRSQDVGLLRVMKYIEREREMDGVLRDAFVDRIWKSIKIELIRDLGDKLRLRSRLESPPDKNQQRGENSSGLELELKSLYEVMRENADVFDFQDSSVTDEKRNENVFNLDPKTVKDVLRQGRGYNDSKRDKRFIKFEGEKLGGDNNVSSSRKTLNENVNNNNNKSSNDNIYDNNNDNNKNDNNSNDNHNDDNHHHHHHQNRTLIYNSHEKDIKSKLSLMERSLPKSIKPHFIKGKRKKRETSGSLSLSSSLSSSPESLSPSLSSSSSLNLFSSLATEEELRTNRTTTFRNSDFKKFMSFPILNPFVFSYKYDQSQACLPDSPNAPEIIIAVPSAPGNFERRKKVRKSDRAKFAQNPANRARLLFFTGLPDPSATKSSKEIQNRIDDEQSRYGDIVQSTFVDAYQSLTKKAAQLFHWSTKYCRGGKFLIRTDDDVKVNIPNMVIEMRNFQTKYTDFILGTRKTDWQPVRDINSEYAKYFMAYEDYPYKYLPPFLLGGALGYPIKTAGLLLGAMRRIPLTWLDDVFVTGICAKKVGVPIFHNNAFKFKHENS